MERRDQAPDSREQEWRMEQRVQAPDSREQDRAEQRVPDRQVGVQVL